MTNKILMLQKQFTKSIKISESINNESNYLKNNSKSPFFLAKELDPNRTDNSMLSSDTDSFDEKLEKCIPFELLERLSELSQCNTEEECNNTLTPINTYNIKKDEYILYKRPYYKKYSKKGKKYFHTWKCKTCSYINSGYRYRCYYCGLDKKLGLIEK